MKKTLLWALISAFTFTVSVQAADLEKQIVKDAKKEAKALKKQGWQVLPGALPLERQLEDVYRKQYDRDELGQSKFIIGVAQPTAGSIDAGRLQAQSLCHVSIAQQCSAQLKGIVELAVANKQLTPEEAVTVSEVTAKSTELITARLGRTVPLMECWKKTDSGNVQMLVRMGYPTTRALEEAKEVVREQLEEELKDLSEKLERISFK